MGTVTAGREAELLVEARVRAALPRKDGYRVFANVAWTGRTRDHGQLTGGEADLVIAHPELGILVVETKAGEIRRDAEGRWWAGRHELKPDPFEQAKRNLHALLGKLSELPDRPADFQPIAGHAVALPDVDLASAGASLRLLGPNVVPGLILDHEAFADHDNAATRHAVDRAFATWADGAANRRPPGPDGVQLIEDILETPVVLKSLLKSEILDGDRAVLQLTDNQYRVLRGLERNRRVQIVGAAGTGKTLLAAEKARKLAREGFETLLVCFNQPLARLLTELTASTAAERGRLTVSTFHQLCEDLATEAAILPPKPEPPTREWWDGILPNALLAAIDKLGWRFHAIVVDEGQDFTADWFDALQLLLAEPKDDVFYVFHDPAQAIFRDDAVEGLGLTTFALEENCRNPEPVHEFAMGHAPDAPPTTVVRADGRPVERIEAAPGAETIEALRVVLHRLRADEHVPPWQIAVLTGARLEESEVWRQRKYGNEVLWNGQVDDAGRNTGVGARAVVETPSDAILCDSIRRFKGLERPVVILVELDAADPRAERLLYVGASRATQHLVVIGSAGA
ncbi:MAG: NERD domain-containing protein [Chloroflexi bacterium]|nr:NERD domain-containing protein [Chloroflexota bacterium]